MRRLNFKVALACMACLAGMTFFGCTNEEDETATENNQRVERLKNKILELADDYGLNVTIDENQLRYHLDDISLDSIENEFKGFSIIKGIYQMKSERDGKTMKITQNITKINVTRKKVMSSENVIFPNKTWGNGSYPYSCYCRASWLIEDGTPTGLYVDAHIDPGDQLQGSSFCNVTSYQFTNMGKSLQFSCEVNHYNDFKYYIITLRANASFDGNTGNATISWY